MNDNIKFKICTVCATGKKLLELDPSSPFCPYLSLYKDNRCPMFEEAENKKVTIETVVRTAHFHR